MEADYRVGGVSNWVAEAGGEGGEGGGEGCSYLFHDDRGHISFTGHWEGDRLVWDPKETQTGRWSPEQEAAGYASSHLVGPEGTLRPDPDWAPPTPEELEGPLASASRGGRDDSQPPRISKAGPLRQPYAPLEELVLAGASEGMPEGCSAEDVAGLLDHFFAAFNGGDAQALEPFFGPDFQYYVHPRNHIEQPASRDALVPFLLERHQTGERMLLLAVKVDALTEDAGPFEGTAELDIALAFHTLDSRAPHWLGALVNCKAQTIVNVGYRSYGLDLIPDEIVAHAACRASEADVEGHRVACAHVTDVDARLAF